MTQGGGSGAGVSGSAGWCGSGRRQQWLVPAMEARTGAAEASAAVAQGIGNGARRLGSGSGGWGGKRYEVNSKSPFPGSFYKSMGSPTVIWHFSL